MDASQFDACTRWIERAHSRRGLMAALVAAGAAGSPLSASDAKKGKGKKRKGKKKKKKGRRCLTVGGPALCRPGTICCDPTLSTGRGCTSPDAPVCCLSNLTAYPVGATCCLVPTYGINGVCPLASHPNCCPYPIGGCCIAGLSECCAHPLSGPYCCPAGNSCCPTSSPTGCCAAREAPDGGVAEVAVEDAEIGLLAAPERRWVGATG
jgi:hypothetical protein